MVRLDVLSAPSAHGKAVAACPQVTKVSRTLARRGRNFAADQGGGVAMMFGLLSVVLFGAVGGAIDFAQVYRARSMYQSALDAGSLAAARVKQMGGTDEEALKTAEAYLEPVKKRVGLKGNAGYSIVDQGTAVRGKIDMEVQTTFLAAMGIKKVPVSLVNTARFSVGTNVELAMMLDVTGSMSGQKIDDLKTAVEELINVVVLDNQSSSTSRVGIAPFSHAVKLDKKTFEKATGRDNSGKGSYKGCVVERTGADAYTDAAPGSSSYLIPLEDKDPGASCDDGREVFPLSDKKSDLKKMVRSLSAGGRTAGHLGTAWAWYLLSPNWGNAIEQSNKPAPYAELTQKNSAGAPKLRKIAVLMTDGEYNMQYSGVDSTTQARAICEEMKKTGIEVFTIGFELGNSPVAMETLRRCATNSSSFYNATNGAELKQAFRDIALKASPLVISQ
jgi:Flp pilus assembly protein TadG